MTGERENILRPRRTSGHEWSSPAAVYVKLEFMELALTREMESELASIAERTGRSVEQIAADVLAKGLAQERRFIEAVEQGIRSADAGRLVEDETVLAWLDELENRESS